MSTHLAARIASHLTIPYPTLLASHGHPSTPYDTRTSARAAETVHAYTFSHTHPATPHYIAFAGVHALMLFVHAFVENTRTRPSSHSLQKKPIPGVVDFQGRLNHC